jgi:hypothetical protein
MKPVITLLLISIFYLNVTAQDFRITSGQYETNSGDKVFGLFLSKGINKNSTSYIFKMDENSTEKNLTPDEVKSITLNNGEYVISIKDSVKQTNFFATRVLSGSLNLYEFYDGDQTAFYLQNFSNTSIIKGKNFKTGKGSQTYKGTLNYFVKGCKQAENKIDRITFRPSDIMQIVNLYNKCSDADYKPNKRKKNIFLEINAGTVINRHYFKAQSFYLKEKQDPETGLAFGVKYSLFVHPKISAYTGLNYRNYKSSINDFQSQTSTITYDANFSLTAINLPLGISYNLINNNTYNLSVNFDYQIGRLLDEGFTETNSVNNTPIKKKTDFENVSTVFSTGLSLSYKKYVASLNYYKGSYIVNNQQSLTTTGIEFLVGYRILDTRK